MASPIRGTDMQDHTLPLLETEPVAAHLMGVKPGTLKAARLGRLPGNPLSEIPHVRVGRSIRYRREDIEAWIKAHLTPGRCGRMSDPKKAPNSEAAPERGAA